MDFNINGDGPLIPENPRSRSIPLFEAEPADDPTSPDAGGCGCHGCGCGASDPDHTATSAMPDAASKENPMTTRSYLVTGMTCSHCADAVTTELKSLVGVTGVDVHLVPDGTSTVTVVSGDPLEVAQVATALEQAGGYHLS